MSLVHKQYYLGDRGDYMEYYLFIYCLANTQQKNRKSESTFAPM